MNNKKTFLFSFLILSLSCSFAQSTFIDKIPINPSVTSHIEATDDGGFLITYSVKNDVNSFLSDGIQILKYDACLQIEWTKEYRIPERLLQVDAFLKHSNGDYYIGGIIKEDQEDRYLFILKIDANGERDFFKSYSKPLTDLIYTIDETASGQIMIFGNSYTAPSTPRNSFLTINTAGEILSATVHKEAATWGRGLACRDGGYIGRRGFRIFKVDGNGNSLWANEYYGVYDASAPVEVTDGYIFASSRVSNTFFDSHFLFKLDFNGDLLWVSRGFQGRGFATLELLPNGNVLCLDSYHSPIDPDKYLVNLLEFSLEGQQISNQNIVATYGLASGLGRDIAIQNDGSILFSSLSGNNRDTLYIGKSDSIFDFYCGQTDNFNEDTIKNINVVPYNQTNNPITFEVMEYDPELLDITLTPETICQSLDFQFPSPLPDTTICEGEEILITIDLPGASIEWEDGSTADSLLVNSSGTYEIEVSFCGETETISYQKVIVVECPCYSAMPNAFTPDGDGKNDVFNLLYNCEVTDFKLDIYNRWGDLVFSSTNPKVGWNGMKNGSAAPMDVYIYRCQYRFEQSDISELLEEAGDVSLIR